MQPIFLFSMPRSGSTLLQRILASHGDIKSVSEPWLLLPLMYSLHSNGVYSEYAHSDACKGINDLIGELPNGLDDYYSSVRDFAYSIYNKLSVNGEKYFLDKTPRYNLIISDVIEAFPDAKIIFLWRNPFSIVTSICETWDGKYWTPFKYKVDLYKGLENMIDAYRSNRSKVYSVKYEDIIADPGAELKKICDFLDVEYQEKLVEGFSQTRLHGNLGDPVGVKKYKNVNKEPLYKWKSNVRNVLRKYWCKRYLKWINKERIQSVGYDYDQLYNELMDVPVGVKYLVGDFFMQIYGLMYCILEPRIFKEKLQLIKWWRKVVIHR